MVLIYKSDVVFYCIQQAHSLKIRRSCLDLSSLIGIYKYDGVHYNFLLIKPFHPGIALGQTIYKYPINIFNPKNGKRKRQQKTSMLHYFIAKGKYINLNIPNKLKHWVTYL